MIIRKLRLQRGWSQDQLSQISGLSTRTIQRIERGQKPSLESLQSLAAAFETSVAELQQEPTMHKETHEHIHITEDEKIAIDQVRAIKGFYSHLFTYIAVISFLAILNYLQSPNNLWVIWPAFGWGIGVASHGINAFELFNPFGAEWEKKQVEKKLGRKL
ncbi:2TM domain-containing protein [Agaribacterium sp. ZY112]|uniref:2TM domain-containing protein n=1 Tax=Agaribacterium sp. ZY112 TaxID=3233574 RepID=UPI0035251E95